MREKVVVEEEDIRSETDIPRPGALFRYTHILTSRIRTQEKCLVRWAMALGV